MKIPRDFMSIATISIAPTPREATCCTNCLALQNAVPRPHSPSRSMYLRWLGGEADQY